MAPRGENPSDFDSSSPSATIGSGKILSNQELMPDAGKVPLKPAELWGKGVIKDFRTCVIDWWVKVRY